MPRRTSRLALRALLVTLVTLIALPLLGAVPAQAATRTHRIRAAVALARHQIGEPYLYGASGPGSFDCSGLTYFVFHKREGFRAFPRTASEQSRFAHRIRRSHMRVGDLMFFTDGGSVYHVGIFVGWRHGRRLVLNAPHTGTRVQIDKVWTNGWFPGTLRF